MIPNDFVSTYCLERDIIFKKQNAMKKREIAKILTATENSETKLKEIYTMADGRGTLVRGQNNVVT